MNDLLNAAPLGKKSSYIDQYSSKLLFPIPRLSKRSEIGIDESKQLPFLGQDLWTGYEISWLNSNGKPQIAVADFIFSCQSPNIIESKSFKLYLNSFNNSKFNSSFEVLQLMTDDLSDACGMPVLVHFVNEVDSINNGIGQFDGVCLDHLDVICNEYIVKPELIRADSTQIINETIYTNLLKSNCLVTGQPDWGSLYIEYSGSKLDHESLLQYIVSFRNHNEFHEQCVERIFMDLMQFAKPTKLSVYARYTRRGGLDINPFRSTHLHSPSMTKRLFRQ